MTGVQTCALPIYDIIEISGDTKVPQGRRKLNKAETQAEIARLTRQMKEAAKLLEFELAAELRDQIKALEGDLDAKSKQKVSVFAKS